MWNAALAAVLTVLAVAGMCVAMPMVSELRLRARGKHLCILTLSET